MERVLDRQGHDVRDRSALAVELLAPIAVFGQPLAAVDESSIVVDAGVNHGNTSRGPQGDGLRLAVGLSRQNRYQRARHHNFGLLFVSIGISYQIAVDKDGGAQKQSQP